MWRDQLRMGGARSRVSRLDDLVSAHKEVSNVRFECVFRRPVIWSLRHSFEVGSDEFLVKPLV